MPEKDSAPQAPVLGGERLRLKQFLAALLSQVEDQATGVEQNLSQLLPEVKEGITEAQNQAQLEVLLSELVRAGPAGESPAQLEAALTAALELAWREERSRAQAREKALEHCIAELVHAARLGTGLKRQAQLTEGLAAARERVSGKGGEAAWPV
ncbi:MAG TPA: hypothetical protein GXX50_11155 [Firmicutes bacterium]|jgi:hypothetical protein|uniref:hypothetical protein n=1 Tax=Gelria sp. Kuro-4 TaxID=2796927 RepID=UPI0019C57C14|nr:hypothetical protein [Gelria sp. Kuro-4]MDK2927221.1 hypothetical protein [Bacillota bacterium]BCV25422.1 hypothetical protein kuro4_21950 [Gelria sp. Kuro-4]HHV58297.1 hypothetical protein [Bacillota bacterium]